MSTQTNTKPFGIKDKFGYMMGDVANDFMFIFASGYLMVFYTEVLKVSPALVATLFLVSRVVDAFTDIGMGVIVDSIKPAKDGRFRSWIRRMCVPVALASFLMYQSSLADASMTVKTIYMFVTYLLWGSICYTSINIPYGSMAASISADAKDRASLSTWRSVGAQLASTVINVAAPVIVYYTNDAGDKVVRDGIFTKLAGVFAICAVICYVICYQCTVERVKVAPKAKEEKGNNNLVKTLFSSRALLALIAAAIFLVFGTILTNSLNPYLYAQYFKNTEALSTYNLLLLVTTLVLAPFIVIAATKFGKKEAATVGMFFTGAMYIILCVLHIQNVWMYVGITFVATFGFMYFQMAVWAFLTDVLDDSEVRTHKRDDGAIYGVYSFARKLGQAIAGGLGGFALTAIGYDVAEKVQTVEVTNKLYTVTTLSQGIAFILVGVILLFVYPLSKKKIEENTRILKERRGNAN